VSENERRLRSLALNDEDALASLLSADLHAHQDVGLDAKTRALVCLGAVLSAGASPVTYQWATQVALAAGATDEEIVGTLIAVAPVSGLTRAVSAAPELAIALGYDVDEALETVTDTRQDD
jgi:alkylhydroperoxidase/carboxymuconolactone decarboxylase family protein YurZ